MKLITFAKSLAAAVLVGTAGTSGAVDAPAAPAPVVAPAISVPCASCAAPAGQPCGPSCAAAKAKGCPTIIPWRTKPPYQTHLCPGACFGYFQTQWSRWEDVCPLPYHGVGLSDAPAQRTSPVSPVRGPVDLKKPGEADPKKMTDPKNPMKGGELPPPRTGGTTDPKGSTDPKNGPGRSTSLPSIPTPPPSTLPVPTGRFGS